MVLCERDGGLAKDVSHFGSILMPPALVLKRMRCTDVEDRDIVDPSFLSIFGNPDTIGPLKHMFVGGELPESSQSKILTGPMTSEANVQCWQDHVKTRNYNFGRDPGKALYAAFLIKLCFPLWTYRALVRNVWVTCSGGRARYVSSQLVFQRCLISCHFCHSFMRS